MAAGLLAAVFGRAFPACGRRTRLGSGSSEPLWDCLPDPYPYGSDKYTWVILPIKTDFTVIHAAEITAADDARV
ncbi:MAG: hypothetical protein LBS77_03250 [Desulfovibrio sp.]|nr:hypothetical protein [Desulfovibrio sp.]